MTDVRAKDFTDYRDYLREYQRAYRETHPDRYKEYYEKHKSKYKVKVECSCGKWIGKHYIDKHKNSRMHFIELYGKDDYLTDNEIDQVISFINMEALRSDNSILANMGVSKDDRSKPYIVHRVEGSLIILKQIKDNQCSICNVEHHNVGPLIHLDRDFNIFIGCPKNLSKGFYQVGSLSDYDS